MNLEQYGNNRQLYQSFSEAVRGILLAAIDDAVRNGNQRYHLQQIQYRAKTVESLRNRLAEKGEEDAENIEEIRKDLAGCRVIFYYNDDVNSFIGSSIVSGNFKVHSDHSKLHYPKEEAASANNYYTAHHYIIELSETRASLPEYAVYKGLKCEIQIHTVLNHAWSETAHDVIYKKPEMNGYGTLILEGMDKRLQKIMKDYLNPAGYEFQKIQYDYKRLLEGKEFFEVDLKEKITKCEDNNKRYEMLERFKESTLPLCDREYIIRHVEEIIETAKSAVISSKDVKTVDTETPYGSLKGKNFYDVLKVSLKILEYIRYVDVKAVFSALIELYLSVRNDDKAQKMIRESIEILAGYDIAVFQQASFFVQNSMLACLEKIDRDTLEAIKKPVADVCRIVLTPVLKGTSGTYESIRIHRGVLPGNEHTGVIRQKAISLIKRLYNAEDEESIKCLMISALNSATLMAGNGNSGNELLALILRDTIEVIGFYTQIIPNEKYEILESIEEDVWYNYKFSKGIAEAKKIGDETCWKLSETVVEKALIFKLRLNRLKEFVVYKTLVGYESVLEPLWNNPDTEISEKNDYREEKIKALAESLSSENEDFWERMIIRCTETESDDLATFPYFIKFLNIISERKPTYMFALLEKHEKRLAPFLTSILGGLLNSNRQHALNLMNSWIDEEKYLFSCAKVFEFYPPLDEAIISKILEKAINTSDTPVLKKVIGVTIKNYDSNAPQLIDQIFFPAVQSLTRLENAHWVNDCWWIKEINLFIFALDENGIDIVLENLLFLKVIDFHAEILLDNIAKRYPKKIIDYFGKRVIVEKEGVKSLQDFDAIPYQFHHLNKTLSAYPDLVIDMVSGWYDGKYISFMYDGGKFVHNIFSSSFKKIENKLIELARTAQRRNFYIVTAILRNYDGDPIIQNVCKKLVKIFTQDDNFHTEIMIALESTGMVEGEFGMMEAYKRKKQEIMPWLEDTDEKVKIFAKQYTAILDKQILSEKLRTEQDIEIRKHRFCEDNRKE
ncbi:MAG: RelA/SpoT domain-containing protein [Rickettsiales bacterium]